MTDLAADLAGLVVLLSDTQIANWCAALAGMAGPADGSLRVLITREPGTEAATAAERLVRAWRRHAPDLPGPAIALALATAAHVQERADNDRARLVISGPMTDAVPVRLTGAVVGEVVSRATRRLLVVSFAAYGVAEVTRHLLAAAHRGVRLDLVLETSTAEGGALRGAGGAEVFAGLRDVATFWHWPAEHRGGAASLHAKVVVADAETALLGSANLTDRGLSGNIEVGVLSHDRAFASRLDGHFRALMRPEARCFSRLP
ncbi:phospholipase D-like protein [Saccharothrix carnea]|uniref:Phospholipase D-like protein n=1 Tax=Saccharothrix carnea TaxID=1280637 RepID=A0A2P8IDM8_SACCR|nr:DISARM system phospholipase D-like protein DrmC [Saccharothrix carnea]PSL56566.1 phospholipase D-like protein [Saccharothrix carnea]